MSTRTRFEEEAKGNSEMAYCEALQYTIAESWVRVLWCVWRWKGTIEYLSSSNDDVHKASRPIISRQLPTLRVPPSLEYARGFFVRSVSRLNRGNLECRIGLTGCLTSAVNFTNSRAKLHQIWTFVTLFLSLSRFMYSRPVSYLNCFCSS